MVAGKPYARTAAITWNLFGVADMIFLILIRSYLAQRATTSSVGVTA
jgi:hypothetical protein